MTEKFKTERFICDEIPTKYMNTALVGDLTVRIDQLRKELSKLLDRPTLKIDNLPHESYFSISPPGTFLKRHMDERHEELKPCKWKVNTRRSISWLLYLSDKEWNTTTNGGQFRYYPQSSSMHPSRFGKSGCHRGNLQVG